ncbi:unnamed protein product, partial [Adineta steineri]
SKRIGSENQSFIIDADSQCARIDCTQPMIKANQQEVYTDDDVLATRTSSVDAEKYSAISTIKKQKTEYEEKLKFFLLNRNCQCDFEVLEAYFPRQQTNPADEHLFSLNYAIVLGKLGRHQLALETFVKHGFYTDAERYCETIYD